MKRSHKIVLWCAASVTLLSVAGALLLHALTDGDRLAQQARDYARKTWSRELTVGKISLTFTPLPRLHATAVSLAGPDWARDKNLLQANEIDAQIELWPLVRRRVVMRKLEVKGFQVNLQHAADGRKSWDLPGTFGSLDQVHGGALAGVRLDSLILQNGTVVFLNRENQATTWQLPKATLESGIGWHEVVLDVQAMRGGRPVQALAKLADLGKLGVKNAVTTGRVSVRSGPVSLVATGELPIDFGMGSFNIDVLADAPSMSEAFAALGIKKNSSAAFRGAAKLQAAGNTMEASAIKIELGKMTVEGNVRMTHGGEVRMIDARLHADRVDWLQTRLDMGQTPLPPKRPGELFYDNPLPWALLEATDGIEGTVRANLGWLKLRSGVEISDIASEIKFANGKLTVDALEAKLLGGTARASAALDSIKHSARVDLRLKDALLGTWTTQTRKKVAMSGGPMQVHAIMNVTGKSMKEMAASVSGPVTINIGQAIVRSQKIEQAEALLVGLTPFLTAKGGDHVNLSCAGATLAFKNGIARGDGIIGVRSDASQILTSGTVDLRQQTLDLHGTIRARTGVALGVSTFANELKIAGKIVAPKVGLDQADAPNVIARVAAAILTGGASIIGTTLWDGAQAAPNPCQVALANDKSAALKKTRLVSRK